MTKEEFDNLDLCDTCVHRIKSVIGSHYLCKLPGKLINPIDETKICLTRSNKRQMFTVKKCDKFEEKK